MQKFYPQQKVWFWDRVVLLFIITLIFLYFSIDTLQAYLGGRLFDQNVLVILAPAGALAGIAISFYFFYQYRQNMTIKKGLALDQKGLSIPFEQPLFIPWNKLLKVEKRDFRQKFPLPYTRKNCIYILYQNSKKSAIWLPPGVYGLNADDLEKEIYSFWKTSKSPS